MTKTWIALMVAPTLMALSGHAVAQPTVSDAAPAAPLSGTIRVHCSGGVAFSNTIITVERDGRIFADRNGTITDGYAPQAKRWFALLAEADPIVGPINSGPPVPDAINCSMMLYDQTGAHAYDFPEVRGEIQGWRPGP